MWLPLPVWAETGESASPILLQQGDVLLFSVNGPEGTTRVRGSFQGKNLPFFKTETHRYASLIGVDLAEPPSRHPVKVDFLNGTTLLEQGVYPIRIIEAVFGTQELSLPKNMVDLDAETLQRVKREKEIIHSAYDKIVDTRLWSGPFIMPVEGTISNKFGFRRILNGQPRKPHPGEDIVVPRGTEVRATNRGTVLLVGDYYFNGKSVFLDHGTRLLTMYLHLDNIYVSEGETVGKGQVIGTVGSTGRATGPHLHWGARLLEGRVNPLSLLEQIHDTAKEAIR